MPTPEELKLVAEWAGYGMKLVDFEGEAVYVKRNQYEEHDWFEYDPTTNADQAIELLARHGDTTAEEIMQDIFNAALAQAKEGK